MPPTRSKRQRRIALLPDIKPTCSGYRVESALDIILLLEACELMPGRFPLVPHRIKDEVYRPIITHGNIFVFERGQEDGMNRWTDCRTWIDNRQMRRLWLVYPESVDVPKVNTYRQGVNIHPSNPNRYLRPGIAEKIGGLHKHTVSITINPSDSLGQPRTVSIIYYVDPAREHQLPSLSKHPLLVDIQPENVPRSKYQFKQSPLMSAEAFPHSRRNQLGRPRRPRAARQSSDQSTLRTPSLSPIDTISSYTSSMSPVTPFRTLLYAYPGMWADRYREEESLSPSPSDVDWLPPVRLPLAEKAPVVRPTLPSIHDVLGDVLGSRPPIPEMSWTMF